MELEMQNIVTHLIHLAVVGVHLCESLHTHEGPAESHAHQFSNRNGAPLITIICATVCL